jgi:hypothetical protein
MNFHEMFRLCKERGYVLHLDQSCQKELTFLCYLHDSTHLAAYFEGSTEQEISDKLEYELSRLPSDGKEGR